MCWQSAKGYYASYPKTLDQNRGKHLLRTRLEVHPLKHIQHESFYFENPLVLVMQPSDQSNCLNWHLSTYVRVRPLISSGGFKRAPFQVVLNLLVQSNLSSFSLWYLVWSCVNILFKLKWATQQEQVVSIQTRIFQDSVLVRTSFLLHRSDFSVTVNKASRWMDQAFRNHSKPTINYGSCVKLPSEVLVC